MSRRGLGRGLDALINSTDGSEAGEGPGVLAVEIDRLVPNPRQPRHHIEDDELGELAASIRGHGVIQPIVVRAEPDGQTYTIVAGERRWRAARMAGLTSVPVVVRVVPEAELLTLAIVENVQRSDLDPIEAAQGYRRLMDESGLTQAEVADLIGKSRVAVANTVRLLSLPEDLQELIAGGRLSEGHGRALLALPDAGSQRSMARAAIGGGWPVRRLEAEVRDALAEDGRQPRIRRGGTEKADAGVGGDALLLDADTLAAQRALESAMGTRVEIRRRGAGGQIVLHFFSEEELASLYDRLMGTD